MIRFRKHPIYNLYAGSKCGKFIHVGRKVINSGRYNRTGYLMCTVRTKTRDRKDYLVHKFIWESNVAYFIKDNHCYPITDEWLKIIATKANQGGADNLWKYMGDIKWSRRHEQFLAPAGISPRGEIPRRQP